MKVRALASISGPQGRKVAGDEFVVSAAEGKDLIDRKLVVAVEDKPPVPELQTEAPTTAKASKQAKAKA
jgi:hypothetical protein